MTLGDDIVNAFLSLLYAFLYAIGALATVMFVDLFIHIPEAVTGLVGAFIIGLSLVSSLRHRKAVGDKGPSHA